jgi:restriction endonuclease Mrr
MTPALKELTALENEHDIHPKDMQAADLLLPALDKLFEDRIGPAPSRDVLRSLVDEAISFRYPNKIPPGYEDRDKKTDLDRAGDYILWRQVIEKASELREPVREVVLVTNETKPDWWVLNTRKKILRPRPELAKEMHEEARATFILVGFVDFVENARQVFGTSVSDDTVEQLKKAAVELAASLDSRLDLRALPPSELELIIRELLVSMGYSAIVIPHSAYAGYDVFVVAGSTQHRRASILIKNVRRVRTDSIREAWELARRADATLVVITTGSFSASAKSFARQQPIELIDGPQLLFLLKEYLHIDARIVDDTPPLANE